MSNGNLTPGDIDALPVGSVIADCDGDQITRLETGWQYSNVVGLVPATATYSTVSVWSPYTLVSKGQNNG